MKARINTTRKNDNKKKLAGAVSMLTVSAMMLSTATYAWFTMSREVEVKNISMTATVPEDIQISLGTLGSAAGTAATAASEGYTLTAGTGVLVEATASETADDCKVKAPTNEWDWSNTADISAYYSIGKLIPASSTTGASIYFTPDANGVGKTVRSDATYYQADGGTPGGPAAAESGTGNGGGTYAAKLYAYTDPASKTWDAYHASTNTTGYRQSTGYNSTYSDGYYVDIPVWLRTSSTAGANINVEAYVIPKTASQTLNADGEALYRAVRVALLNPTQITGAADVTPTGLLPVADGLTGITSSAAGTLATAPFSGTSVLDWYNGVATNNVAVKAAGNLTSGAAYAANIYGSATVYTAGTTVVSLAAGSGTDYGKETKVIVRVWLEGEDKDCWNDTAGQDWSINLKFNNGTANDHDDIKGNATTS